GSPAGHGYYKGRDVPPVSFSWAWGAGSMVSTAADVARFYRALFGGKLLRPQQLKQMETTVTRAVGAPGGNGRVQELPLVEPGRPAPDSRARDHHLDASRARGRVRTRCAR